jgi:hypothetical protein
MNFLVQLIGVGLVVLACADICLTVLFPGVESSLLSMPLSKGLWRLFHFLAHRIPSRKKQILFYSGPTLVILLVVLWVSLLIVGFALIAWPGLGSAIQTLEGPTPTNFTTALYYSGYSLTTLGTGNLAPQTPAYQLLMVIEAALGFSIFTLTITYLLSVYGALIRRNTLALSLRHRTADTADAAEMLVRLGAGGDFTGVQRDLGDIAQGFMHLLSSQRSYPVLFFFHYQEIYYALPRIIYLAIDTTTLVRSALEPERYRSLVRSSAAVELWGSSLQLLTELYRFLPLRWSTQPDLEREQVWRHRYYQAVDRLRAEGITTIRDLEAGLHIYIGLRRQWEPYLLALTEYMAYDWQAITPAETQLLPWDLNHNA